MASDWRSFPIKEKKRKELEKMIEDFLRNGGTIQKLHIGETVSDEVKAQKREARKLPPIKTE